MMLSRRNKNSPLSSILYTQLIGISLGIDQETLGIDQNELNISGILDFLQQTDSIDTSGIGWNVVDTNWHLL